ncbi:hypothetical protein [Bacillus sp. MRMR6]|nr:hypothetical protein [Bacillus sp. MRMR6]
MNEKPIHYDGSVQNNESSSVLVNEPFTLTDEIRASISGNPYSNEKGE